MWILRIKRTNNHELSSSISALQSLIHAHYSTKSTTQRHPISHRHFMVDFFVKSLGFSEDQALSATTKVSHLKSTRNPASVVDFFKQCGLDTTQIRNIVCFSPLILTTSVDKTLEPKFRVFQGLGLSGSALEKLFKPSPNFSSNRFVANVNYLRKLLDNDEKVIKVIHKSWWLLSKNFAQKLSANLLVLKKYGLSNVASMTKSKLEMKFGIYRSFEWSDSEIVTMVRALPFCLRRSEAKLRTTLNFFMNELGYSAAYLATHPKMLVYSLEKRVMPRNKVLEILKEKKLLKSNISLCSVVALSEVKFVKDFVLPYHNRTTGFLTSG
ncbi:hypothetical protein L6452_04956 [Arctium lappa]|uniref:Uncharacterized protein n=1 Tax=Arctium lappa TaxID=4217 RepID=A0ACB9EEM3_ARCLA|nr:hypothetical protein L6452_04956 [Arctium lappa]